MSSDVPEHPVPDLVSTDIVTLAAVASVGPASGIAIKRGIEHTLNERDHSHSQLYRRLDRLAERGLVEKDEIDGLENKYRITERGEEALREVALWVVDTAGL